MVIENKGQEANDENSHNDVNVKMLQGKMIYYIERVKYYERKCNTVPFHAGINPHLKREFCAQKRDRLYSSSPRDIPLQHVHGLDPSYTLNYHVHEHFKHTKIIVTCSTKDIKIAKAYPEFVK